LRIKRALDIALALLALVVLSPLLVGTAIGIKLTSRGPVLISQLRDGRAGTPFRMLKFRTMFHDMGDLSGVRQTTTGDCRITPLGRWLRRRSIDELPQLCNVLLGDMSLVGPRPHPIGMQAAGRRYDELVPYYTHRHAMRPGLSGWAQCNGLRGPTDDPDRARARIDHDLAYIQNFNLWLDMRIIVKTLARELPRGTGS
jgi:lipopolysaccharide/colanic/teichoic acid biosynthesis glycosyltransferase